MGKLLKILGWTIGLVLLLVAAAVLILPQVVDPNDYKDEIISKVKEQTGRDLTIDGRIELSVFPWLGVETGAVALGNAKGFEDKAFAAIKSAGVRVKLMPLLSRKLEVDRVDLKGLELNLTRLKDGTSNWDDLAGSGRQVEGKADSGAAAEGERSADGGLAGLTIGGIDISDARIVWDDRSSGQTISLDQFRLNSGPVASGKPVDLQLGMLLKNRDPAVNAKLDLKGVVKLNEAAGVVNVDGLKITLDAAGDALPRGAVKAVLEAAVSAALNGSQVDISGLSLNAGELKLSGDLKGRDLAGSPAFSGNLDLAEFNLRKWMGDHAMPLPAMADANTLTRLAAGLKLNAEDGATRMSDLAVRLDESQISGSVMLRGSAIGFDLNLDAIDVDRYLPSDEEKSDKGATAQPSATASTTGSGGSAAGEETLLPVETLRGLDIDGTLSIGRLTIKKLLAEQIKLVLKAKGGQLNLGQQVSKFYQGGYSGESSLDVRGKTPRARINAAAAGIQIGPLLQDLSGQERLTGKGRFSTNLDTQGNSVNAFRRTLRGKFDFNFEDGAVKGFNAAQVIREAKARLSGKPVPKNSESEQTDFSELSGSGTITNGVLSNQDLLAKSPYLRVNGAGEVNLVQESLDYRVEGVVVNTSKGQGGEGLDELQGVVIPVHLTGPLASPKYTINWEKVLLESQKGKIKEKIQEKLEEKLKGGKLPEGLQDTLKGLFN